MRIISWNIAVKTKSSQQQIDVLAQRQPDIVALQEVSAKAQDILRTGLEQIGLPYIEDTVKLGIFHGRTHYNELIASRWPLTQLPVEKNFSVPFPESVLSVKIDSPAGAIEVHTTHVPPGCSNDWIKIETFEAIYQRLASASTSYRILCGDFNAPQEEKPDGRMITWGQRERTTGDFGYIGKWGERWDAGERSVLEGLALFDLPDIFRLVNGYMRQEFSWYTGSNVAPVGRRFDHIFASKALCPKACQYIHTWREEKLSDHSAVEAVFDPETMKL